MNKAVQTPKSAVIKTEMHWQRSLKRALVFTFPLGVFVEEHIPWRNDCISIPETDREGFGVQRDQEIPGKGTEKWRSSLLSLP